MINKKELKSFLVKAKKATYASGDNSMKTIKDDKSTTIVFEDGDWLYHDNYFGGEPYGGREVVFYKSAPVYIMTYYGNVSESVSDIGEVYKALMGALTLIPEEYPYRGPELFKDGNLIYTNNYTGGVDNFSGEEIITKDGEEIYKAKYIGGLIDQR